MLHWAVDVEVSSVVPPLWQETQGTSAVSHSPQNHLALEKPGAVLPSYVGLVE